MSGSSKVFAAFYFLSCASLVVVVELLPSGTGPVVVFASPWGRPAVEVIAGADGRLVDGGRGNWVAVAQADAPGFVTRLYQSGAGFVASTAVARACAALTGLSREKT